MSPDPLASGRAAPGWRCRYARRPEAVLIQSRAMLSAVLLLVVLPAVGAAHAVAADGSALPEMSQQLQSDQKCVHASTAVAEETPWPQSSLALGRIGQHGAGRRVTVAVLDTGVDAHGSPQLAGQVTLVKGASAGKDCVGHGTFVAGLIAAKPRSDTAFSGIAPQARIDALKVTDDTGAATAASIAAGIDAAVAAHARIIEVSVGTPKPSPQLKTSVKAALVAGALVIASATLDGQQQPARIYPAAYPQVLSVADAGPAGAVRDSAVVGAPPDLTAPGQNVVGIGPGGTGNFTGSGASYATAFAAGAAALVESYRGDLTPVQLAHRLETTAVHPGGDLPDPRAGYGAVDPYAAMTVVLPEESGPVPRPAGEPRTALRVPPPPGQSARHAGLATALGASLLTVVVVLIAMTVVRGRRRGWKPGGPIVRTNRIAGHGSSREPDQGRRGQRSDARHAHVGPNISTPALPVHRVVRAPGTSAGPGPHERTGSQ